MKLVKFSHDEKDDDPFVINPARADPNLAIGYKYPNWKGICLAANKGSLTPPRLIVATICVCLRSHVIDPMVIQKEPVWRIVKEFLGVPLRGELERSVAFYGLISNREVVGVRNFGVGPGERQTGLVFQTFAEAQNNGSTAGTFISIFLYLYIRI